jgi:transcription antitermination factor NusA-like protein
MDTLDLMRMNEVCNVCDAAQWYCDRCQTEMERDYQKLLDRSEEEVLL